MPFIGLEKIGKSHKVVPTKKIKKISDCSNHVRYDSFRAENRIKNRQYHDFEFEDSRAY